MGTMRAKMILVVVALVVVGLAVGLTVWLTSGNSSKPTLSHEGYARLYQQAVVGQTRISVTDQWPKPPYQDFHDGNGNHCFEWFDKPTAGNGILYDLCFNPKGVLASKQTP